MRVLVTGGAGYIGGVFTEMLQQRGLKLAVLDDLSRGHRKAVDPEVPFYQGRTGDRGLTARPVVLAQLARTMRNDGGSMKIR